jgi:hypothetical protein
VVKISIIFWDKTPCGPLKVSRRFRGTYRLHLLSHWCRSPRILLPWRWRWYVTPKCGLTFNGLHSVISRKIALFNFKVIIKYTNREMTDCDGNIILTLISGNTVLAIFIYSNHIWAGRSQWPRGLRHELSSLARKLGSWVRIPHKAWMSVLFAFILCLWCSVCR